jgi:hypothetical protein
MIRLDLRDLSPFCSATMSHFLLGYCSSAASAVIWRFHDASKSVQGTWEQRAAGAVATSIEVELTWDAPTEDILQTHANQKDATEYAAYAVAFAIADALGFKVIGRAHQGSGADWIMVRKGEPANDYYKLEVSGMAEIGTQTPASRLAEKLAQGRGGDRKRPGVAVVARFEDVRVLSEAWQ